MNFRKNLEVEQSVVTAGGIYGKIKELEDNVVVLEIAAGVKIRIDRNSIFADMASTQKRCEINILITSINVREKRDKSSCSKDVTYSPETFC